MKGNEHIDIDKRKDGVKPHFQCSAVQDAQHYKTVENLEYIFNTRNGIRFLQNNFNLCSYVFNRIQVDTVIFD